MAAKDLRGETNLTKCLAMGSKKGTMWHARLRGRTSGLCAVSQPRPRGLGGDADSRPHASVYASVTLCLRFLSQSIWSAVKSGQSARRNKGSGGILSSVRRLLLGAAVEMSDRAEMREVSRVE